MIKLLPARRLAQTARSERGGRSYALCSSISTGSRRSTIRTAIKSETTCRIRSGSPRRDNAGRGGHSFTWLYVIDGDLHDPSYLFSKRGCRALPHVCPVPGFRRRRQGRPASCGGEEEGKQPTNR